ncbi:MAG: ubiquinone/menaquinone biosynthesis C-methylase UbiE [Oceanicoccus sp.]|jgi:ubiquinone/menaquinone biosynthesis C-methylase UbiE
MIFKNNNIEINCREPQVFEDMLDLDGKHILELGCGRGDLTRLIATEGKNRRLVATEVDELQHAENKKIGDLPNVNFVLAGAQKIPAADETFDRVLMFKSLHHVPVPLMEASLLEIKRVLKPGGLLYISEPLFQGDFNEVLRIFHDEEIVREAAFKAIVDAVEENVFELLEQKFFNTLMPMTEFSVFENAVINVTHTDHKMTPQRLATIKEAFDRAVAANAGVFSMHIRVDLLKK